MPPFSDSRSSKRLALLLGMEPEQSLLLWRHLDMRNLLQFWPGPVSGNGGERPDGRRRHGGDAFPRTLAREAADRMLGDEDCWGRLVILCGRRVADAFGFPQEVGPLRWLHDMPFSMAVLPHPSPVSHWWNERENVVKASLFMQEAAYGEGLPEGEDGAYA